MSNYVTIDLTYSINNGRLYRGSCAVQYLSSASEWFGTDDADAVIGAYLADNPGSISAIVERHEAAKIMRQRAAKFAAGSPCYIRFGKLPKGGRSRNHITGELEAGVSVYPAAKVSDGYIVDMRGIDAGSGLFIVQGRDAYLVTGDVVGMGSDGEPLLANCKARKMSECSIVVVC